MEKIEFVKTMWPYIGIGLVALAVLVFVVKKFIVFVPNGFIATMENMFGKSIETGRILARDKEMGVRRKYLTQGWHGLLWPITKVRKLEPVFIVKELGFVVAKDGSQLPPDRKFADDPAGNINDPSKDYHNKFQDADAFFDKGGIRGPQLRLLTAGPIYKHPDLFEITEMKRTHIDQDKVGVVIARDGKPLRNGQQLADKVPNHNSFQDAAAFIANGGQVGPQLEHLGPGDYNINSEMFVVKELPALKVSQGFIAILIAKIGKPLPKGDVCAVTPAGDVFTDAAAFIAKGGFQGPQSRTVSAGTHYINPWAFDNEPQKLWVIEPGEVAARISFIGVEPKLDDAPQTTGNLSETATDPSETHVNSGVRAININTSDGASEGERGLQKQVLSPGVYPFNHFAENLIRWPITVRTIEWDDKEDKDKDTGTNYFTRFETDSFDGQKMKVAVRLTWRVLAENVPFAVRNFGSPAALESGVIHPQLENIFGNQVAKVPAINYVQSRPAEVALALAAAKEALAPYRVEVTGLLITKLIPPEALTELLSKKSLAVQESEMYAAKEKAQAARILFENKSAEADQQKSLRLAETGVTIAEKKADAVEKQAAGEAKRIIAIGNATAAATKATGTADAEVIQLKGDAEGLAMQRKAAAIGPDNLARLEVTKAIGEIKMPLVPQIMMGNQGQNGGGMADLLASIVLPKILQDHLPATTLAEEPSDTSADANAPDDNATATGPDSTDPDASGPDSTGPAASDPADETK